MEALGRTINPVALADGAYVSLRDVGGVAFSCYLAAAAGDPYTLVEAKDAAAVSTTAVGVGGSPAASRRARRWGCVPATTSSARRVPAPASPASTPPCSVR